MSGTRRNAISHADAIKVLGISVASGVLAAVSGASPTGSDLPDVVLCFAWALFVGWLGASAPWWGLAVGAGLVLAGSAAGPLVLTGLAAIGVVAALWIGAERTSLASLRSLITLVTVQVGLRLDLDQFFLASALVAGVAMLVIAVTGWQRRHRYVRRRVLWGMAGVGAAAVVAVIGLGIGGVQARSAATTGYQGMLDGLEFLQDGDLPAAASALRTAAADLDAAEQDLDGPFTQLSTFVPVVAQNRNGAAEIIARAADAATSAADTLDVVDLDQLTIANGVIDVAALELLEPSLTRLETTVTELIDALEDADNPWLLGPLQSRLDTALRRADQVEQQARGTAATARLAPAMLGIDGPRRYLFLFTNSAESRGTNGLMGNWSEITIERGRLSVSATGRANDLVAPLRELDDVTLDMPAEFFDRYGRYGAGTGDGGVDPKFWSNITMSPDMPTVGMASVQLYEQATGRTLDGVIVVDPEGLAALLGVTGPIQLDDIGLTLGPDNAEEFLTLGQYEFVENEREDLLTEVTERTVAQILGSSLPAPQQLARALGPAAVGGHITAFAVREEDQELIRIVGFDGAMPPLQAPGVVRDGLAVVVTNANGNKIDSFLQRTISYTASHDPTTGATSATLVVELTNTAPTSGYPDYVIGNLLGLPAGTNRMIIEVFSPLLLGAFEIEQGQREVFRGFEAGWNVFGTGIDVPPGETITMTVDLYGVVGAPYELVFRPQALPNDDQVTIEVDSGGDDVRFEGVIERRSVLSADGVRAWR